MWGGHKPEWAQPVPARGSLGTARAVLLGCQRLFTCCQGCGLSAVAQPWECSHPQHWDWSCLTPIVHGIWALRKISHFFCSAQCFETWEQRFFSERCPVAIPTPRKSSQCLRGAAGAGEGAGTVPVSSEGSFGLCEPVALVVFCFLFSSPSYSFKN